MCWKRRPEHGTAFVCLHLSIRNPAAAVKGHFHQIPPPFPPLPWLSVPSAEGLPHLIPQTVSRPDSHAARHALFQAPVSPAALSKRAGRSRLRLEARPVHAKPLSVRTRSTRTPAGHALCSCVHPYDFRRSKAPPYGGALAIRRRLCGGAAVHGGAGTALPSCSGGGWEAFSSVLIVRP